MHSHLATMGGLMETTECNLRNDMDSIYINKTKQIINTGRIRYDYMTKEQKQKHLMTELEQKI
jgi:hypothetical protein